MTSTNPNPGDLQVDGPYSPMSLEKVRKQIIDNKEFSLLLDQSGMGFALDDPSLLYMTAEERLRQAHWWLDNKFDGRRIPAWLYRYLHYMYNDGDFKYKDHLDVAACMQEGKITEDCEEYKQILGLIKYCKTNTEAAHLIGFIILFVGTLHQAVKEGVHIGLFIETPETALHPQRQAKWMCLFYDIKQKWYWPESTNPQQP